MLKKRRLSKINIHVKTTVLYESLKKLDEKRRKSQKKRERGRTITQCMKLKVYY